MTEQRLQKDDRVVYKSGRVLGYEGRFLGYEEQPYTGGDCRVSWYRIEGHRRNPVIEANEHSSCLLVLPQARYYECGICDCLHPIEWDGDCREDAFRFGPAELDEMHGQFGWDTVPMPGGDEEDELGAGNRAARTAAFESARRAANATGKRVAIYVEGERGSIGCYEGRLTFFTDPVLTDDHELVGVVDPEPEHAK